MTHPKTLRYIKTPILDLVSREFTAILEPPAPGKNPQEFPLPVPALEKTFKADFAYKIKTGGWCFIEDDSEGTCLSNLLKYSAWVEETKPERPIWIFHIIAPKDSAWIALCKRESERLKGTILDFRHVIITTPDWPESAPRWLDELQLKMKKM